MKSFTVISLLAALQLNAYGFSGQENEGGSLCGNAKYTCTSENEKIVACAFVDKLYVSIENESSQYFPATQVPQAPEVDGSPIEFKGEQVELSLCGDCSPVHGITATLNVSSLGLNYVQMLCLHNRK